MRIIFISSIIAIIIFIFTTISLNWNYEELISYVLNMNIMIILSIILSIIANTSAYEPTNQISMHPLVTMPGTTNFYEINDGISYFDFEKNKLVNIKDSLVIIINQNKTDSYLENHYETNIFKPFLPTYFYDNWYKKYKTSKKMINRYVFYVNDNSILNETQTY